MASKRKRAEEPNIFQADPIVNRGDQRPYFENTLAFKTVDRAEQNDVDRTILDYLANKTTRLLLESRSAQLRGQKVDWSDAIAVFNMTAAWNDHVERSTSAMTYRMELRLSLMLLVSLFTRRFHSHLPPATPETLLRGRQDHRDRLAQWHFCRPVQLHDQEEPDNDPAFSWEPHSRGCALRINDIHRLDLNAEVNSAFVDGYVLSNGFLTLGDILPEFLKVTVLFAEALGQTDMNNSWYELAGKWMMLSALEACQIQNIWRDAALDAAFPYGGLTQELERLSEYDRRVQQLFCHDLQPGVERAEWTKIRQQCKEALLPIPGRTSGKPFQECLTEQGQRDFEVLVLDYLQALCTSLPTPDLQQVENGRVEGVSRGESEAMLGRIHGRPGTVPVTTEQYLQKFEASLPKGQIESTSAVRTEGADGKRSK